MKHYLLLTVLLFVAIVHLSAQEFIYSKEGRAVISRESVIYMCLQSLKKGRSYKTALQICKCQAEELDRRFTNKQYKKYTTKNRIDFNALIKEDSLVERDLEDCYTASGQSVLLQAENSEEAFLKQCREAIQQSSEKTLDPGRVAGFCQCQLEMVKAKKLTDEEMKTLGDPNSLLFFEMMYRCGSPYAGAAEIDRNWKPASGSDVKGPASDTINVLSINGMTYVKVKIGSLVKVWLFDTGASDLLINTDMEEALKKENILSASNYLGIGEYEMANGTIESCRRYRLDGVRLGSFTVDNLIVSVSEKGQRIIVGKTLLNKFRNWTLNNQENKLVLQR